MAYKPEKGESVEVLGTCMTNTIADSQHVATVEYWHMWSYAQQAAMIAVSEKNHNDGCYYLITDPERRAKRIAAHYAQLYFDSAERSGKKLQFYWPALAAFVVKDIVEAYRFARADVLQCDWRSLAGIVRNSLVSDLGSYVLTDDSPYQHALRTYAALAKGNLWLFMDIYPWLWFFLHYVINSDGSLCLDRARHGLAERDWNTYQRASKAGVEALPYGPSWMARLGTRLKADPVYKAAHAKYANQVPLWTSSVGYGVPANTAPRAHMHCRMHAHENDNGYRTPAGHYWTKFPQAFYVMTAEHTEMARMCADQKALAALVKLRNFKTTPDVANAYEELIKQYSEKDYLKKREGQFKELVAIARHEQMHVLQPLIYADPHLKETMDVNHQTSRLTNGWLSPKFKVIYKADAQNDDSELETVFDAPKSMLDRFSGTDKSLPNEKDRMGFVKEIAKDFHGLMNDKKIFLEGELKKIMKWIDA